jgi:hypothetical protein
MGALELWNRAVSMPRQRSGLSKTAWASTPQIITDPLTEFVLGANTVDSRR